MKAIGCRRGVLAALGACVVAMAGVSGPVSAQLFWQSPNFRGEPVNGDEPNVVIPLTGATEAEREANIVWTMRAGLNVAALQCEFAPSLMTRTTYNDVLTQHKKELATDYKRLGDYFKRMAPKGTSAAQVAVALDQYTTRTYNSFSTLNAQYGFCQVASSVGQQALMTGKGSLARVAKTRLREMRNSLVPQGDMVGHAAQLAFAPVAVPGYAADCYDKKGRLRKKCL